VELKVDRGTKILLGLILLVLAANLLRSVPPTPALAQLNSGDTLAVEALNQVPIPLGVQGFGGAAIPVSLQTVDGTPVIIGLAAGEGDRVYFYDGGSLWASRDAGANWTKVR